MDEEGRSVEEQIRRGVEEQNRRVVEQVRRVEDQMLGVEEQIRGVDEEIEKCSDEENDKKLQLKRKALQLHKEKLQLLKEKLDLLHKRVQLRDEEESLLLDGPPSKCTEFEFLRQVMPPWHPGSETLSPVPEDRMFTPVSVKHWDVVKDIEEYINMADKWKRRYEKLEHLAFAIGPGHGKNVALGVAFNTCDLLNKKGSRYPVSYTSNVGLPYELETDKDRDKDANFFHIKSPRVSILLESFGKGLAALEVKSGGLGCPVPIHTLWARCSCRTGIDLNCWCNSGILEGQARRILNCILQVYEYLVLAKIGYGILTDIQNWYLLKRDHTGCLYISEGFKWDGRQPPVAAAIAYLVNSAVDNYGEFDDVLPTNGRHPWSWEHTPCSSPGGGSKDDGEVNMDSTCKTNEHKTDPSATQLVKPAIQAHGYIRENKGWNFIGGKCRNKTGEAGLYSGKERLPKINESDLHLKNAISISEWSRSYVVGGTLSGRGVAVKFSRCKTERAEALLNEVGAYQKLQKHWGDFVPALIGYGTTCHGQDVFVATEFIDGSPLGPETMTEDVATAARQALRAVHECNLLHGHVEARNILVVRGAQSSVRLIDFSYAQCKSSRNSRTGELERLEGVLRDATRAGVGKESARV